MTRQQIDAAVARYTDRETLYDRPYVDGGRARVSGPFTVEAVPAPTVRSLDDIEEDRPEEAPPADASIARFGSTLRHSEWRQSC
jgi:adenine-specific DNA-methyltransferase